MNIYFRGIQFVKKCLRIRKWIKQNQPLLSRVEQAGLSHVAGYMARLVKPSSPGGFLMIGPQKGTGVSVLHEAYQLYIQVSVYLVPSVRKVKQPSSLIFNLFRIIVLIRRISAGKLTRSPPVAEPEKEQAIRRFFAELNIAPDKDSVRDVNGYADAIRHLRYPINNCVDEATELVQRLLREVYHVQEADGLSFLFMDFNNLDFDPWTEQDCKRALETGPNDVRAREGLAYIYLQQQRYAEAEEEYRRVLATDPGNEYARTRLADLASVDARRKRKQSRNQNITKPFN